MISDVLFEAMIDIERYLKDDRYDYIRPEINALLQQMNNVRAFLDNLSLIEREDLLVDLRILILLSERDKLAAKTRKAGRRRKSA